MRTTLIFVDVEGGHKDLQLPLLRLSDRIKLRLQCRRQRGGRREALDISGEFRVVGVEMDATQGALRQILQVASTGVAPAWRAIKASKATQFGPARHPRTPIS